MQQLGTITPTLEEFREHAATRRVVPVRTTVLADALTPVGLYRALAARDGHTVLQEELREWKAN